MKVSVSIPTYNRAWLIRNAIDSVLRQTYRDFEIIVIDDGSTDATAAIVAEYGDHVRYFAQPNRGLGAARNAGLERSRGDVVAFLDSDDEWFDFKLRLQVEALRRMPDVACLYTEFVIQKDDGSRTARGSRTWLSKPVAWPAIYPRSSTSEALGLPPEASPVPFTLYWGEVFPHFLHEALVLPTTAVVRRDAIGSRRFTEGMTIFEDWEFFARISRSHAVAFLDIDTAMNRGHDHPDRLTRCSAVSKARSYREMIERMWTSGDGGRAAPPGQVHEAFGASLLAVAREELMASNPDRASEALAEWRRLKPRAGKGRALAYGGLTKVPGGGAIVKGFVVGRRILSALMGQHARHPVNPAA